MSNFETNRAVINGFRLEVADKVRISDASGWSSRLVYKYLLGYRNKLLHEKMRDKGYPLTQLNSQPISCIILEEVPASECPCQPVGEFIFQRSLYPIPNIIGQVNSVNDGIGTYNYDYIQWSDFKYRLSSRFEADVTRPYWTLRRMRVNNRDGVYLITYNQRFKTAATLSAVFSDPLDAFNYPSCTGDIDQCFRPLDKEFIMDQQLIPILYDLAIQQLMKGKTPISDIVNDNQDNVSNTQIPIK